ncbi:unnamed protein product [Closterium sp. NIES-64]|nr:unnamed protein product [Closterium sp. NIES-64]CAI6007703.1 unnamed protein product [Closterium sp. NIES-65]
MIPTYQQTRYIVGVFHISATVPISPFSKKVALWPAYLRQIGDHLSPSPLGGGSQANVGALGPLPSLGAALRPTWGPSVPFPPWGRLSGQRGDPRSPSPPGGGSHANVGTLGPLPPWGRLSGQRGDPRSPSPPGGGSQANVGTLGPLPPLGAALRPTWGPSVPFPPWGRLSVPSFRCACS